MCVVVELETAPEPFGVSFFHNTSSIKFFLIAQLVDVMVFNIALCLSSVSKSFGVILNFGPLAMKKNSRRRARRRKWRRRQLDVVVDISRATTSSSSHYV
jgi:hypothetical protein